APDPTPIGRTIDDFTVRDVFGRPHALAEWADSKLFVVAFLGTECPLSKLYGPRLDELAAEFGPCGAAFIGVNPNAQDSLSDVAYTKPVSRLLQRRCVECHRAGEPGPFPLTDCKDAAAWSAMMREVVADGRMPPWFADPKHGRFRNDARLGDDEKQLLFRWI